MDGRNTIEVFAVLSGPRLVSLRMPEVLVYELRGEEIVRSDGRVFYIVPDGIPSIVESAGMERGRLLVTGWAADLEERRVAETLLLFTAGGRCVFDGPFNRARAKHAEALGEGVLSGFRYRLPVESFGGEIAGRVRIFALHGDRATELRYGPKSTWLRGE